MDVAIDLEKPEKVNTIQVNFLQDTKQWIFRPEIVYCLVSEDGKEYKAAGKIAAHIPLNNAEAALDHFEFKIGSRERFIRLKAENIKTCPDWHIGKGQKAWIFADEIIVN